MKLIVLDRDGVINNESDDFIKNEAEWEPIADSLKAIAHLTAAGFKVVIASNQSGLGRGLLNIYDLQQIHHKMNQSLSVLGGKIDSIFICPHHPVENCTCRKPLPGMFTEIIRRYDIENPANFYAIGDSMRDLQAAQAAGFKPWLVLTGNGHKTVADPVFDHTTPVSDNLAQAVEQILNDDAKVF